MLGVSCGNHKALTCSGCPQGHGKRWCNGDCAWVNDQCIEAKPGDLIWKKIIYYTFELTVLMHLKLGKFMNLSIRGWT